MNKVLIFDMDGTIADLYGVENWLPMLRAEDATPYSIAEPLYNMEELVNLLNIFKANDWIIAITTWGAKNSSTNYDKEVAKVKKEWLEKYNFPFDLFFFQKYGTPKNDATNFLSGRQILIDDNEEVRKSWKGETINATKNIIKRLEKILAEATKK